MSDVPCGMCLACTGPPPPDPLAAVGDLEHALGRRDEPARTRTGSNE